MFEKTLAVVKNDELNYGFTIRIIFCLLNEIIMHGDCTTSLVKLDVLFSALDNTCETVRHTTSPSNKVSLTSKNSLLSQLHTRNIRLFDIFQVVGAMLYFHIIIYKAKVLLACGHKHEGRKALHVGLDVCRLYFGCVLQSPGVILFDAPLDEKNSADSGRIHDARLSSIIKDYLCSFNPLNLITIDASVAQNLVVGHMNHLLRIGTILCAQFEHTLCNFSLSKALLNESVVQTQVSSELRCNEACVALRMRETHLSSLLFNQSLEVSIGLSRDGIVCSKVTIMALSAGLYGAGLSLLRLSKPLEAFSFFAMAISIEDSAVGPSICSRPHVWIRLAECCLQREALRDNEASVAHVASTAGGQSWVESVSSSRSRRVFLRPRVVLDAQKDDSVRENGCDLLSASQYLRNALNIAESNIKNSKLDSVSLDSLLNNILLRLGFVHLKLRDPVSAVTFAKRLEARLAITPTSAENYQARYLNCSYLVQALSLLRKYAEASELLKSRVDADCTDDVLLHCVVPLGNFLLPLSPPSSEREVARAAQQVNKAIVLLLRGHTSAALTIVEAALRVCADYAPAVRCLLFIYIRQGRNRQALNVMNAYKLSFDNL